MQPVHDIVVNHYLTVELEFYFCEVRVDVVCATIYHQELADSIFFAKRYLSQAIWLTGKATT